MGNKKKSKGIFITTFFLFLSISFLIACDKNAFTKSQKIPLGELITIKHNPDSFPKTQSHDYYHNWYSPIKSYLVATDNGYMRVQLEGGAAHAIYYNNDFTYTKHITIPKELEKSGAFYATNDNYFLLTGQDNPDNDENAEVLRITKYDKNWNRLASKSLHGWNTNSPFTAGSANITHVGNFLFIHTCHTMFNAHQANLTFSLNITTMEVVQKFFGVGYSNGYCSHSFNQHITNDENHIVQVDHGDAYPRSIVLTLYRANASEGKYREGGKINNIEIFPITGKTGANYTGVSLGGVAVSTDSYLVVGNSINQKLFNQKNNEKRNIFISATNKIEAVATKPIYLTKEASKVGNPYIVTLTKDTFLVIWTEDNQIVYQEVNGFGRPARDIFNAEGTLSDCKPIVKENKIVWFVSNNKGLTFYALPFQAK